MKLLSNIKHGIGIIIHFISDTIFKIKNKLLKNDNVIDNNRKSEEYCDVDECSNNEGINESTEQSPILHDEVYCDLDERRRKRDEMIARDSEEFIKKMQEDCDKIVYEKTIEMIKLNEWHSQWMHYEERRKEENLARDLIYREKLNIIKVDYMSESGKGKAYRYSNALEDLGINERIHEVHPHDYDAVQKYHNVRRAVLNNTIPCSDLNTGDEQKMYTMYFYRPEDLVGIYNFVPGPEDRWGGVTYIVLPNLRIEPNSYFNTISFYSLQTFTGNAKDIMILLKCGAIKCEYVVFDESGNPVMVA